VSVRIRVDATQRTAVAHCSDCPPWRELRGTRTAALTAAADHAELVHGDTQLAGNLRVQARRAATRPPGGDAQESQ